MYKLLFIIFSLFMIMYSVTRTKEGFVDETLSTPMIITSDNVADYIYNIYKVDVKAIQNLAEIAIKLQDKSITIPGNMIIQKSLTANNNITLDNGLKIKGNTTINNNTNIKGNLIVSGMQSIFNSIICKKGIDISSSYYNTFIQPNPIPNTNYIVCKGNIYMPNNNQTTNTNNTTNTFTIQGDTDFNKCTISSPTITAITQRIGSIDKIIDASKKTVEGRPNFMNRKCDKRIKENIKMANSCEILNKINNLQLSNYNYIYNNYIDKKFYNGDTVYGLIAQDVMKVFPEAVNLSTQYIPNINKFAKIEQINNNVKLILNYDIVINKNDNIKLLINYIEVIVSVIEYDQNYIIVNKWDNYNDLDNVYVYGSEIDDFHSLDPIYLGMLSWGGIQELTKQFNNFEKNNKELIEKNIYNL